MTASLMAAQAMADAAAALTISDYNDKRSALQRAVTPLFLDKFTPLDLELIKADSEFIADGTIRMASAAPSNFIQRLHPNVCVWIIASSAAGRGWGLHLRRAFLSPAFAGSSRGSANTFGYPASLTPSVIKDCIDMINAATPPTVLPVIDLDTVVTIFDHLMADGMTADAVEKALSPLLTPDSASTESARSILEIRSRAPDEIAVSPAARQYIDAINGAGEPEAEDPASVGPKIDLRVLKTHHATLIDEVLIGAGIPKLSEIVEQANKAVDLASRPVASAPPIALPSLAVAPSAGGAIPAGTIIWKNAADVFGVKDPKRRPTLNFEVPTGDWAHAHPHIPAIDNDYAFDMKTLVPILLATRSNDKPWLRGHTGTGKTTLVEQVYARLNLPVYRVNLDSDLSRSELVGRDTLRSDETGKTVSVFVEGIIPKVMQEPCALLLDEIDASRPDLGFVLQRLVEGSGFMLLEDGGRTIIPHPVFRIFATANTNGRGDESGLYTGTRVLGSAFVDRFKPFLNVEYMDPRSEAKLIESKVPALPKPYVDSIVTYAKEHRVAFTQGQVTLPFSPRGSVSLAERLAAYLTLFAKEEEALRLAFEHSVANAADADDAVVIRGISDRIMVVKSKP